MEKYYYIFSKSGFGDEVIAFAEKNNNLKLIDFCPREKINNCLHWIIKQKKVAITERLTERAKVSACSASANIFANVKFPSPFVKAKYTTKISGSMIKSTDHTI